MTRLVACAGVLVLLAMELQAAPPLTADQLVARVIDVRKATGFRIRATLTRSTPGSNVKDVRQLLIKGRRERARGTLFYQQLWPKEAGGHGLVIEDTGDHRLAGFLYRSNRVTRLTDGMLGHRFFDSDLLIEDLAEDFWYWPSRKIAGEEAVGEHRCVIVDLRPAPGTPTSYSLIRTWLSPDLAIGLRAEQFDRDGGRVKQIGLYRILKVNDRWMPTIVTVEPADGRSRTVIEGAKYEPDAHLSASDFTVAAVRRALRARD